jgi:signal transduction histidine kinase
VQFTPDGGIVKVRIGRQLGDFISITVQDQGPGIPDSDLPHIFDPFYSGGEVMQHSTGVGGYRKQGMGLGLAIVRHFIEMHGGNIGVSTGPTGSIFTITIPVEPPLRAARPTEPEPPSAHSR